MKLKVLLPTEILVDEAVRKITAEAANGSFCLLPRHIDFVTALVPGLLSFETQKEGQEVFVAVAEGVLVKSGEEVLVSVRNAARGGAWARCVGSWKRNSWFLTRKKKQPALPWQESRPAL
jgi:F-type H+-transporting ATPase subunit epsilon